MGISDIFSYKQTVVNKPAKSIASFLGPQKAEAATIPAAKPSLDVEKFLNSIGSNETGGVQGNRYAFSQPSGSSSLGNALGKYQVTEGELKSYGKRFLGQDITPQQYLASTTAQDNYMRGKANYYAGQGYSPQEIADIHRKGIKNSFPAGSGKFQSPDYVNKFNMNYNK